MNGTSTVIFKSILLFIYAGQVTAQECDAPSRNTLAKTMLIAQELEPHLHLEILSCKHIKLHDGYASFILDKKNASLNGGIRSEISIDYPFIEGETVEYRWAINLPPEDTPGGDASEWWLIAQWHDQPDRRIGETWATFKAQNPPLAIYVEKRNGVVGIGLQGLRGKKISWTPVTTGVWLDVSVRIRWSTGSDGYAIFRVDDHPEFDFVSIGRNMLNGYQHYFKAGQYRSPTINTASQIYIKNVRFSKITPRL